MPFPTSDKGGCIAKMRKSASDSDQWSAHMRSNVFGQVKRLAPEGTDAETNVQQLDSGSETCRLPLISNSDCSCVTEMAVVPEAAATPNQTKIGSIPTF